LLVGGLSNKTIRTSMQGFCQIYKKDLDASWMKSGILWYIKLCGYVYGIALTMNHLFAITNTLPFSAQTYFLGQSTSLDFVLTTMVTLASQPGGKSQSKGWHFNFGIYLTKSFFLSSLEIPCQACCLRQKWLISAYTSING